MSYIILIFLAVAAFFGRAEIINMCSGHFIETIIVAASVCVILILAFFSKFIG